MRFEQTNHIYPAVSALEPQLRRKWAAWLRHAKQCMEKSNEHYLLNRFKALLAASSLIIMVLVGIAIYWIYSSAMVKNAETSAISVVKAIMSAEVDNLLQEAPDGRLILAVNNSDLARLDLQMQRYLKFFEMRKITLFTPDNKILYSTDPSIIGQVHHDEDLNTVISSGEALSRLQRSTNVTDLGTERVQNAAIVEAYAPILDAGRRLLGVFEVNADLTKTRDAVLNVLWLTMTALGAVLSMCLYSLYLPMKRGTLDLIDALRELKVLSTVDYLTGAYNRHYFDNRIKQEFFRRRDDVNLHQESIAFIMADIDYFKNVNDTFGHITGDEVLRQVSRRLKERLRDFDVMCRYGGEEFLIMLPLADEHGAMMVAERIRQNVIGTPVQVDGVGDVAVTVSFGVACSRDGAESEQTVIERADGALLLAKQRGRNQVVLAPG